MASEFEIGTSERMAEAVLENHRATRDAMSVKRVFGEAYQVDRRTIIPVATVAGGAGGGGGEGEKDDDEEGPTTGFGSGFGLAARPVGVFVVEDTGVEWKPVVDTSRMAMGGQILAGLMTICFAIVFWRRSGR